LSALLVRCHGYNFQQDGREHLAGRVEKPKKNKNENKANGPSGRLFMVENDPSAKEILKQPYPDDEQLLGQFRSIFNLGT